MTEAPATETTTEAPAETPGLLSDPSVAHASAPPTWKAELPQDLLQNRTIQEAKSIEDLARMTLEAQSLVGKDKIAVPGPNATIEEKRAFYSKLGSPEKPEDFSFDLSKWDNETMGDPGKVLDEVRNLMFEEGVSKTSGEKIINTILNSQVAAFTEDTNLRETTLAENMKELKTEWGDAYDKNVALAQYGMNKLDESGALAELLKTYSLDNNPTLVKFMANAAKQLVDDAYVPGDNGNTKGFGPLSPGDAKAEMERMKSDPETATALFDKDHIGHAAAVEKFNYLSKVANPE